LLGKIKSMAGQSGSTEKGGMTSEELVASYFAGGDELALERYLHELSNYHSINGESITDEQMEKENRVLERLLGKHDVTIGLSYRARLTSMLNAGSNGANLPVSDAS
jgi:hypothetical protein